MRMKRTSFPSPHFLVAGPSGRAPHRPSAAVAADPADRRVTGLEVAAVSRLAREVGHEPPTALQGLAVAILGLPHLAQVAVQVAERVQDARLLLPPRRAARLC